ncbi:hypothetical protein LAZ67_5003990 [Cordylochernes scorpioides]|uniref:Histone-lysine N-methyltransferase SETMAR n=1 Tax=Cordylochernes scorpioides TaxID=51811 RepID=A0ABY6KHL8_9ARAC|nr:hypothetical protein LAZ67_5003990 [Cordylochernes scorpioides]
MPRAIGRIADKLFELRFQLFPHPPYSPYLIPCDFFLFPNLKKRLGGRKFSSNEEAIDDFISFTLYQPGTGVSDHLSRDASLTHEAGKMELSPDVK